MSQSEDEDLPQKQYSISATSTKLSQKYGIMETTYKVKFNEDKHGTRVSEMNDELHDMFNELLEKTASYNDDDRARLIISHEDLQRPIYIHCQPRHQITTDTIMER